MLARRATTIVNDAEHLSDGELKVVPLPLAPAGGQAPAERVVRYERGSQVYATDGPVGTLRQLVIDEEMGEVKALVVRMAAKDESVLVPPELVDKSVGAALLLNVTKAQFVAGASRSPRFNPRTFTAADTGRVAGLIPLVFRGDRRRSVVRVARDAIETSDVIAAAPDAPPSAAPRPLWKRFRRRE